MSESIYTKMKQKQPHHENPQSKRFFFSIFDILMENGNNKLILAFQLA
jgi:hypothetical protein